MDIERGEHSCERLHGEQSAFLESRSHQSGGWAVLTSQRVGPYSPVRGLGHTHQSGGWAILSTCLRDVSEQLRGQCDAP